MLSRHEFFHTAKTCLQELYLTYICNQPDNISDILKLNTQTISPDISCSNKGQFNDWISAFSPIVDEKFSNEDNLPDSATSNTNCTTSDGEPIKSRSISTSQRISRSLETMIVRLITKVEVPDPGMSVKFAISNSGKLTHIIRSAPNPDLPKTMGSTDVYDFFRQLGISNALTVFEACLMETKVLIISISYGRLMSACTALEALIYPLKYSHVYIPLLPSSMLAIVEAPTPYIIGTHADNLEKVRSLIDSVLVVNLDVASVDFVQKQKTKSDRYSLCTLPTDLRNVLSAAVLHIFRTNATITSNVMNDEDLDRDDKLRLKFHKRGLRSLNDELLTSKSSFHTANIGYSKHYMYPSYKKYSIGEQSKLRTDLAIKETNHTVRRHASIDALLKSTFFHLFACIMRGYANHFILIRVWPKTALILDKAKLLRQNHFDEDEFMQKFVNTMLFHKFIEERGLPTRRKDTFDALCNTCDNSETITFTDIVKLFAQNELSHVENAHNDDLKYYINEVFNSKQYILAKSFPLLDAERIENLITARPLQACAPCVVSNESNNINSVNILELGTYTISTELSQTIQNIPNLVYQTEKQAKTKNENLKMILEFASGGTPENLKYADDADLESEWVHSTRISILNLWLYYLLVIKDLYGCCHLLQTVTNILPKPTANANMDAYYQVIVINVYNTFEHDTCTMLNGWQFILLRSVLSQCLDIAESTGDIDIASQVIKMSNSLFFKPRLDCLNNSNLQKLNSNCIQKNFDHVNNKPRIFMSDFLRPRVFANQQSFWLLSFYADIQKQLMGLYSYKFNEMTSIPSPHALIGSNNTACAKPQELLYQIYQNPSESVPESLNNRDLGEVEERSIFSLLISYIQSIINAWMYDDVQPSISLSASHKSYITDTQDNRQLRRKRNFGDEYVNQSINEMRKFLIQFVDNVCSDTLIKDKRKKEMHVKLDNIIQLESENLKYPPTGLSSGLSEQIEYLSGLKEHAQKAFDRRRKLCQSFLLAGEEILSESYFCVITDNRLQQPNEMSSSTIDLHPAHESQSSNSFMLPPFSGALFVTNLRLLGVGNPCFIFKTGYFVNFRLLSIAFKSITKISIVDIFDTNPYRRCHVQKSISNNLIHSTLFGNTHGTSGASTHGQIFDPYCHPEVIINYDNGVSHLISLPYIVTTISGSDSIRYEIDQLIKPILLHLNIPSRSFASPECSCINMPDVVQPSLNSPSVSVETHSSLDVMRSKMTTAEIAYDGSLISNATTAREGSQQSAKVSHSPINRTIKCSLNNLLIEEYCRVSKIANRIPTVQEATTFISMTNVTRSSMLVRDIKDKFLKHDSVSELPVLCGASHNAKTTNVGKNKQFNINTIDTSSVGKFRLCDSVKCWGILTDYIRMNFNDDKGQIEMDSFNKNYTLCATYPSVIARLGINSINNMHSTFIAHTRCFKYNRFPVVVFRHSISRALIIRSAKLSINSYKTNGRGHNSKSSAFGYGQQQLDTQSLRFENSDSSPCYTYSEHSYAPSVYSLNSIVYDDDNSSRPLVPNLISHNSTEMGFYNDLPSSQTISSINSCTPSDSLRPLDALSPSKSAMHFTRSISNSINLKFCKRLVQSCERMNSLGNLPVAAPVDSSMGSLGNNFLQDRKEFLTDNPFTNQYYHGSQVMQNTRTTLVVFDLRDKKIRRMFRSNQLSTITKCYRQMYPTMRLCFLTLTIQSAKDIYSTWTKLEEVMQFSHNQVENARKPYIEYQFQSDRVSTPPGRRNNTDAYSRESCDFNSKKLEMPERYCFNGSGSDTVSKSDTNNEKSNITKKESIKKQARSSYIDPQSAWLLQINILIKTAWQFQGHINDGTNILISLEDGDVVTSQLSALTQIITDPYYRTTEGMMCLIQKEWFDLGYVTDNQGSLKMGATPSADSDSRQNSGNGGQKVGTFLKKLRASDNQKSKKSVLPYIIQFLDAVHQILCKNPNAFAFNDLFLQTLCLLLYSSNFFQTRCSCEQEKMNFFNRLQNSGDWKRISLRHVWNYIAAIDKRLPMYRNFQYTPYCNVNCVLNDSTVHQHGGASMYKSTNTIQDTPHSPLILVDPCKLTCPFLCDLDFWLLYSYDIFSVIHSPLSDINYCSLLINHYFHKTDTQSESSTCNKNASNMDDDPKDVKQGYIPFHNNHDNCVYSRFHESNLPFLLRYAGREIQMLDDVLQLAIVDEVLRLTLAEFCISKDNLPIIEAHTTSHDTHLLMDNLQAGANLLGSPRSVLLSRNHDTILPAKTVLMHDVKCAESCSLVTDSTNMCYHSRDWKRLERCKAYIPELCLHADTGSLNPLSKHNINIEHLTQSNCSESPQMRSYDQNNQNSETNNRYCNLPVVLNSNGSFAHAYRYKDFPNNRRSYQLLTDQEMNLPNVEPSAHAVSCTIAEADESSSLQGVKQASHYHNIFPELFKFDFKLKNMSGQVQIQDNFQQKQWKLRFMQLDYSTQELRISGVKKSNSFNLALFFVSPTHSSCRYTTTQEALEKPITQRTCETGEQQHISLIGLQTISEYMGLPVKFFDHVADIPLDQCHFFVLAFAQRHFWFAVRCKQEFDRWMKAIQPFCQKC